MFRKWPGNDFEKIIFQPLAQYRRTANVTSAGRSFQIREPTTGKARLVTVDMLTGAAPSDG